MKTMKILDISILSVLVFAVLLGGGYFVWSGCSKQEQDHPRQPSLKNDNLTDGIDRAMMKGVQYLLLQQNEKGAFTVEYEGEKFPNAGGTALAIYALTRAPDPDERIRSAIAEGAEFLAGLSQKDGGIYLDPTEAPPTYVTAVSIMALSAIDKNKYRDVIKRAQDYLAGIQGQDPKDRYNFGGIGYGSDGSANLSTTQFAVEALKESDFTNDEAFQRAITFLSRCQNNSETNDMPTAGNDGGFFYSVHSSKAGEVALDGGQKGYRSYGSMTYAGIKSYVYAGLDKDDPRVQNALKWLKNNYTVDVNPGMDDGNMGLFYYFHTMAKTLDILQMDAFEDSAGIKHDWRKDLAGKIIALQLEDGSWQNVQPRWFENVKILATSYSVIALSYCRY